jgi:hypothetical protein
VLHVDDIRHEVTLKRVEEEEHRPDCTPGCSRKVSPSSRFEGSTSLGSTRPFASLTLGSREGAPAVQHSEVGIPKGGEKRVYIRVRRERRWSEEEIEWPADRHA